MVLVKTLVVAVACSFVVGGVAGTSTAWSVDSSGGCPALPMGVGMSAAEIEAWVRDSAHLGRFAPTLREHEMNGLALSLATTQDLSLVAGLPLGAALTLKHCVDKSMALEGATPRTTRTTTTQPVIVTYGKNETTQHKSDRRVLQGDACEPPALEAMLAQCCSGAGDGRGHRRAQTVGCDSLPDSCDPACAAVYIPFYSTCPQIVSSFGNAAEFERFFDQCRTVQPPPSPPAPAPAPLPPLLPPAPTPGHCVDSATWVSDTESAGCAQYAPGETSYQAMCAVHRGQYVSPVALSEGSAQASSMFLPVKVTAAEACPVACGLCPSCDDGIRNGGETGIDCGGPCVACTAVPSCGPIETTGLIGSNMEAVCTGQSTGDSCYTRPAVGFRPSTAAAAFHQCSVTSTCGDMDRSHLIVPQRDVIQGQFTCTPNGRWSGEPLQVLPILPTVCPPQVVGDHYKGECDGSATCTASCDEGYPRKRGDGLFTCQGGVWIGDLVCQPISCGETLDKAPAEESAFSVCTNGDTLGSSCTSFCREGFYSSVGTGVASFECMKNGASEGGLWMQQGFSPWWESSLQCTRCPTIENCRVSSCTTGSDAQCSACAEGFYGYRHDETPTRCLPLSVTFQAAGFDEAAAGIFSVVFSGALGADFADVRVTTTIPPTASVALAGTGTEPVGMNFEVNGGSLSLRDLVMASASLSVNTVGQIAVHRCTGEFDSVHVTDATLTMLGGEQGLSVTNSINLQSNQREVSLSSVDFAGAQLTTRATVLDLVDCGGALAGVAITDTAFTVDETPLELSGSVRFTRTGSISLVGKSFSDVQLSISGTTVVQLQHCNGNLTALTVSGPDGSMTMDESNSVSLSHDVRLSNAGAVTVSGASCKWCVLTVAASQLVMNGCSGTIVGVTTTGSTVDISGEMQVTGPLSIDDTSFAVAGAQWAVSSMEVSSEASVQITDGRGTISSMRVNGRTDTGPMGSCDGTNAEASGYCVSYNTAVNDDTPPCRTWDSACIDDVGSCCTSTGSIVLCEQNRLESCRNLALGATVAMDDTTAAGVVVSCASRYRGPVCDIVPHTCRSYYGSYDYTPGRVHGQSGDINIPALNQGSCNGCGNVANGCDGRGANHRSHGGIDSFTNYNNAQCIHGDYSC